MAINALEKINNEITKLPESEQLLLAKMIIDRLVIRTEDTKHLDFRDLRGVGKGTWSKDNVESYIRNERDEWNDIGRIN
ncbi:MAG: hypothetical protein AAB116_06155 [Candidatus Poribacteria bacterium]